MRRYLARSVIAQARRSKTLLLLTIFGVALGVASVVCIQVLNRGSLSAFAGSVRAISGQADLSVVGRTPTIDETLLVDVLADPDVIAAWPLYRVDVAIAGQEGLFLEVIGFDLFAPLQLPVLERESDDRTHDKPSVDRSGPEGIPAADETVPRLTAALVEPGWVALTPAFANEMGWVEGDTFRVSSGSRSAELVVGALVDFQRLTPLATRKLAVMDIAQAQHLLGREGRIHQIDVELAEGSDAPQVAQRLEARLGPTAAVRTPEQRREDAAGLLSAFRLNLTALSLISVFVGVFLIYSSVQASLVRRRREFGLLRSLGSTPSQVMALILIEATLLGVLGTAIGIPVGHAAAVHNVETVSATLTNLYLLEEIERLVLPTYVILIALAVGGGGAVLGALLPSLDVSRRDTSSLLAVGNLHARADVAAPRLALVGLLIGILGVGWFLIWGHRIRAGGFVLGFLLLVVLPLWAPLTIRSLCAWVRPRGFGLGLSLKNLGARLRTTSSAVAALAVCVSMMVGITLLIGSFRETLRTWLDVTIRADIYVSTESWIRAGSEAVMREDLIAGLAAFPSVRGLEEQRRLQVQAGARPGLPDGGRAVQLSGITVGDAALVPWAERMPLMSGEAETVAQRLRAGEGALVSEPLARKESLSVGDSLRVIGPRGEFGLAIVGITYDYSSEGGAVLVSMPLLERHFGPGPSNNVALYIEPGRDVEQVVDHLKARFRGQPLVFRSNRTLRGEVMDIFDQTFAITRILQMMALVIAGCGISLTLLIAARERAAELALWRALGALRRQIFVVFLGEGLSMGLLGLILGAVGGVGLSALLILVINRAYFGWTIRPALPGGELLREAIIILLAAVAASIYPALRGSRTPVSELSREDLG